MRNRIRLVLVLVAAALLIGVYNYLSPSEKNNREILTARAKKPKKAEVLFGIPVDSFHVEKKTVQDGESFGTILLSYGIGYPVVNRIANEFSDVFDVRKIRKGKSYAVFCENRDSSKIARYLVYEDNPVEYYVFDLADSVQVYQGVKEISLKRREISGQINSSLYQSLQEKGASAGLTMRLADIYAWSIDFFRINQGDYFKVIYEEKYIDDTINVGTGKIIAAEFNHAGKSYYSFHFAKDNYSEYFDEEGNTLRRAFLKAPLNFSRISSRYTPKRFHPVLKRWKAHLGTDYAAPHGTPIMATANGEVIAAGYTSGNGNYVKIKHNSTYTTQYLHMSKFAKGMRKGVRVKQGEVIGYVGSTGLATGPHVCYRFWKNGQQVDPYKQDLPTAEPVKEEYREEYEKYMQVLKKQLDALPLHEERDEVGDLIMASAG